MPVLERGTTTPPNTLVFVPIDGRIRPPLQWATIDRLDDIDLIRAIGQLAMTPMRVDWILVAALVSLRNEFNQLSPNRNKASDGSIGDTAHAASSSDHNPDETGATPYEDSDSINEVHAIDVTAAGPWPGGITMQTIVDYIAAEHRAGRDDRLQYIIYNARIISRSWNWDSWHVYTGANPHDKHAHFSCRYTTAQEADTSSWGVANLSGGNDLVTTQAEFNTLMHTWATSPQGRADLAVALLTFDPGANTDGTVKPGGVASGDPVNPTVAPSWALSRGVFTERKVDALTRIAGTLLTLAQAEAVEVPTPAADVAQAVVAALGEDTPQETAAALLAVLGASRAAEVGAILATNR